MLLEVPSPLRRPAIKLMEWARKTNAMSLLPELLESQWWSLEKLEALQEQRLAELGQFCQKEVPWYQDQFQKAGLAASEQLTPENLTCLPLMRKETIRLAGSKLRSLSFDQWQPRKKSTSGSTGQPLNYYLDNPSHSFQWGHLWRGWHQVQYLPGDQYATLSGGSLVPEQVSIKQKIYLTLSGAIHLPSYHLTNEIMSGYFDLLAKKEVPFLYGYPSSLELFSQFALRSQMRALPMKAVFTTSEGLTPKARETIQSAFGCPVIDTYGCNDGGLYSYECSEQSGFHVGMESVFVEITDDQGNRLPDGEIGNIVTTNLAIRAMPLLRYVTGDVGAISREACPCGRGLMRIVNLQGRDRDFVLTPAGRKVHGAFFNHFDPFYEADWLERFQVYQPDQQTLVVRLQTNRHPTNDEQDYITSQLEKGLGKMDFQLVFTDEMEYTRTGKFRVITSDIT